MVCMMMSLDYDRAVQVFDALADPQRLRILYTMSLSADYARSVQELMEDLGVERRERISYHLQVLRRAELLTRSRRGTQSYYRLTELGRDMIECGGRLR